jgi:hypothetical protein
MENDHRRVQACLAFCIGITTDEIEEALMATPPRTALSVVSLLTQTLERSLAHNGEYLRCIEHMAGVSAQVEKALLEESGTSTLN